MGCVLVGPGATKGAPAEVPAKRPITLRVHSGQGSSAQHGQMTHALMRKAWPMGIRSLLRKVFGRSAEPVPEMTDATSASVPSQAERTPLDVAAELVAASFDNPTVPPQSAPRDREPGTLLTAPAPDPTVPEARRPQPAAAPEPVAAPAAEVPAEPVAEPAAAEAEPVAEVAATEPEPEPEAKVETVA